MDARLGALHLINCNYFLGQELPWGVIRTTLTTRLQLRESTGNYSVKSDGTKGYNKPASSVLPFTQPLLRIKDKHDAQCTSSRNREMLMNRTSFEAWKAR